MGEGLFFLGLCMLINLRQKQTLMALKGSAHSRLPCLFSLFSFYLFVCFVPSVVLTSSRDHPTFFSQFYDHVFSDLTPCILGPDSPASVSVIRKSVRLIIFA